MEILEDVIVPKNTGHACIVKRRHLFRIMAESTVDLVAFNLDNLYERFDQGRTKANQGKICLSTEMNCLVAVSACPETDNSGRAIRVQVCRK